MIKEPASKEWFAKHDSPKKKALYKAHKAVGGTIHLMTQHHPEMKKHIEHEKLLESRKESYNKFRFGK